MKYSSTYLENRIFQGASISSVSFVLLHNQSSLQSTAIPNDVAIGALYFFKQCFSDYIATKNMSMHLFWLNSILLLIRKFYLVSDSD